MTNTPLAVTLFGAEDLRLVETPLAPLAPGMVRVRFGAGGICGSDLHYFLHARTGDFVVTQPLVLGHEVAGEIVEMSGQADGLRVGTRVAVNPSRWCGTCPRCREGRENLCENIYFMGSASKTPHMQGGFSSYIDAIPAQCIPVPPDLPYEAAALAEPLAVALHAVARGGSLRDRSVVVLGGGPIGLMLLLAAKLEGARSVVVIDVAAAPLAFAEKLGADGVINAASGPPDFGDGVDVVFEATGSPAGLASAIAATRRGGVLVQVGNLPGGQISVPAASIVAKELAVFGTFRFAREYNRAVELIAEGAIDVTRIITARLPLARAIDAFRLALDRSQSVKVALLSD